MNVLNLITSIIAIGGASLPIINDKKGLATNITSYPYATAGSHYRTTENKTIFTPLVLMLDFKNDSVYSQNNQSFVLPSTNFRANISGVELALVNTSGSWRSPTFRHFIDFSFPNSTTLRLGHTFVNNGTTTTRNDDIIFDQFVQYHTMVFEYEYTAFNTGSNLNFRWGNIIQSLTTPFTNNIWETTDANDTNFNAGWRMLRNGSNMAVSTWSISSELTNFKFVDIASLNDTYYQDIINFYYDLGKKDADSTTLIQGFTAIVGILVNFVLMILNLSVLGVSLLDIFAVMFLFVGLVWILKLIRG